MVYCVGKEWKLVNLIWCDSRRLAPQYFLVPFCESPLNELLRPLEMSGCGELRKERFFLFPIVTPVKSKSCLKLVDMLCQYSTSFQFDERIVNAVIVKRRR